MISWGFICHNLDNPSLTSNGTKVAVIPSFSLWVPQKKGISLPALETTETASESGRADRTTPPAWGQDSPPHTIPLSLLALRGRRPWPLAALDCLSRKALPHPAHPLRPCAPAPEGLHLPAGAPRASPRFANLHALSSWAQLSLLWPSLDTERWGLFLFSVSKAPSLPGAEGAGEAVIC